MVKVLNLSKIERTTKLKRICDDVPLLASTARVDNFANNNRRPKMPTLDDTSFKHNLCNTIIISNCRDKHILKARVS
jgi:hypothetical protein